MIQSWITMPQGAEWLVILVVVVFVFGAAKLPELARGTGQALRIFRAETKGMHEDVQVVSAGLDASGEGSANRDARAD
jgi:sec-independent protein translocase protein TatA